MNFALPLPKFEFDDKILDQGAEISRRLNQLRMEKFPPNAKKTLRQFSMAEVAHYLGVTQNNLKRLHLEGKGPVPAQAASGRRSYTAEQMLELRHYLDRNGRTEVKKYVPHRKPGDKLQVIAVVNFKGGSGKTTTSAHLAQHLAMAGFRVLAVDLDPQASMSALFGYQPELDLTGNDTLYGAIRYDGERRLMRDIIRKTYFDGLDLIPGNLELQEFEHTTPQMLADRQHGAQQSIEQQLFFARVQAALDTISDDYDVVVIDCPPQLGFLTLSALCAATSVLVTVHPQMLDVASMSQFLFMTADLLAVVREAGGELNFDFMRYLITRFEPNDAPQQQIAGFLRSLFGDRVLTSAVVKSTAFSDAGLTKQTLYEVSRDSFTRATYDRAIESLSSVNAEIQGLIFKAWNRPV